MNHPSGDILLVGSVPLRDAEDVIATCCGRIGSHLASVPDGETGDRIIWVVFQAYRVFAEHPDLETVLQPAPAQPGEDRESWMPTSMDDLWDFRVKVDPADLKFDNLLYSDRAAASYATFQRLRDAGKVPVGVRFQVSLPLPLDGVAWFFRAPGEVEKVLPAYTDALKRETEKVCRAIPADDLAIQWDVCWEVLDIEGIFPWAPSGDPRQRYIEALETMTPLVPAGAKMGLHLCYADLGHRHMKEPEDLALVVEMANTGAQVSKHHVDWVHMPVPRDRSDEAYFVPLNNLDVGDTRVFLGLVHYTDGTAGSLKRAEVAKKYLPDFGIATECGLGRRGAETIPRLLSIHGEIAASL